MLSFRFSTFCVVESKALMLHEVLVLPVRSSAVHFTGEIGWALVTLLSHGEVERYADSRAVFAV